MAGWSRCAKCSYIRHVNDGGRSRRDTCPMCGAVYEKAEIASAGEERRRRLRGRNYLIDTTCGRCRKTVTRFTRWCPHCKGPVTSRRRTFTYAAASGMASAALVAVLLANQSAPVSPFPGLSNGHFLHCVEISKQWSDARSELGLAAEKTLSAQNEWHASCSRKALRSVAENSATRLPTTPEGWLVAGNP